MPASQRYSPRVATVLGLNPSVFTGPGTNTYLVGTGPRPILLDAGQGVAEYPAAREAGLREHSGGAGLQSVVVTHAHIDHLGGVAQVLERFGDLEVVKMPWPDRDTQSPVPVKAIGHGAVIHAEGATLRAIHTPGHAPDHLCYYLEEERALFTGDVVLGVGTTVIPDDGTGDLGQYMASLRLLLELEPEIIYPAHGPANRDPRRKLEEYISHRELRERQVIAALEAAADAMDVMEIVREIYTDVPEVLHRAAAMSMRSHLRKLGAEGKVGEREGRWSLS
jgi:glyoxylase-like metal-dependent hydrolase (beta-lactamase superfamily II)